MEMGGNAHPLKKKEKKPGSYYISRTSEWKCSFMAILKVVGFLVNFCSCSSFQTFGKAK